MLQHTAVEFPNFQTDFCSTNWDVWSKNQTWQVWTPPDKTSMEVGDCFLTNLFTEDYRGKIPSLKENTGSRSGWMSSKLFQHDWQYEINCFLEDQNKRNTLGSRETSKTFTGSQSDKNWNHISPHGSWLADLDAPPVLKAGWGLPFNKDLHGSKMKTRSIK